MLSFAVTVVVSLLSVVYHSRCCNRAVDMAPGIEELAEPGRCDSSLTSFPSLTLCPHPTPLLSADPTTFTVVSGHPLLCRS